MRKIGNIELKTPFVLAPMAGVTNMAFRTICVEHGASLTSTEMISDKGLLYRNQKTIDMLKTSPNEHPVAIQLFGSTSDTLVNALKIVDEFAEYDILDINMGCPVNKVVKAGSGSALMKDEDNVRDILRSLRKETSKPITIKIRAGWDSESINCDRITKIAEEEGIDAVTIHARTRTQLYRGEANIEYVKKIREKSNIFLIGSGDVKTLEDAKRYFDVGCDAVMIGRAALGNPWIFDKLNKELNGEKYIEPTDLEVIDTLLEHARRLKEISSEKAAMTEMRTHAVWYFKRLPNSKSYRLRLVNISTFKDLEAICEEYKKENKLI